MILYWFIHEKYRYNSLLYVFVAVQIG